MTITLQAVNELIQSLESAGELSIKERKYLELAKVYADKEAESVAQALTFQKCRELSGCPAGVDLQDWVKQLAEENLTMKDAIECHKAGFTVCEACGEENGSWNDDVCKALDEIAATDRIVAGIKADGVEEFAKHCDDSIGFVEPEDEEFYTVMEEHASDFAKQLREGADK
uniref:hypothetical protein n=1 Tax=Klebsiella aerogenes TaxID=548 RepID=UPI001F46E30E|nr:hypothetical protein [Klebsiella aerogenes]